jgi:hypothetical protein
MFDVEEYSFAMKKGGSRLLRNVGSYKNTGSDYIL